MRLTAQEIVELPQDRLFDRLADLDELLHGLGLGGEHLTRLDGAGPVSVGSTWEGRLLIREAHRPIRAEITEVSPPRLLAFMAISEGLRLHATVALDAISETSTELALAADLSARSLSSKIMLQALRVAGGELSDRLDRRLAALARQLEGAA